MTKPEPRCKLCDHPLKVITVRVPIWSDWTGVADSHRSRIIVGYEERDDVCDCERCHGAY